tara:strand:- start:4469 stop:5374 length:906 start_codon:yes stop_codon:yes gene_type:complete
MNMSKIEPDAPNPQKDEAGDRVQEMMAQLQQQAEQMDTSSPEYNSAVNTPQQIQQSGKADNGVYLPLRDLPTKYRLYQTNTLIEARPLKVIEVKKLASMDDGNIDVVINDILRRTVRGVDVNNIFLSDKLYIIFWLRGVTFRDSSYTVPFNCSKCKHDSEYHFEISNLNVDYLKDEYDPNEVHELEHGDTVTLRFLQLHDEFEMERFIEINKKAFGEIDEELLALATMITSVNGEPVQDLARRYNYVLDFSPRDLSRLSTYVSSNTAGITPKMDVTCKKCGGVTPIGVTFHGSFFLPQYSS